MLSVYGTERIQVGTEPVADSLLHNWGDDKQDLLSRAITEEEAHQSCHHTTKSAPYVNPPPPQHIINVNY